MRINWRQLLISLLISWGAAGISMLLAPNMRESYSELYQPPLAPPGWVFPLVWAVLYTMMGIAAYLVYHTGTGDREAKWSAFRYYLAQLAANIMWPVLFFQWGAYFPAFAWLVLLWYLVYMTTVKFYRIKPLAGFMMVPYLVWLTFAGYLNLAIALAMR